MLPRLYSLNRSRQRCEVENLLVSLPNLLYDCIQIEAELIEALGTNSVTKKQSSHCNKPPTATKDDNYISSSNVNCSRLSGPNSNSIQSSLKVEADGRPDDTLDSCIRSNRLAQKRIAHVPSSRRHKAGARRSARHKVGPTQPHDSGCCPNADSRGQSKLASFIQQDMATSDVSTANSRIKEELLDLENITCGGDRLPKPPTQGLYLRLSSYISYFYLHLAWDYLVSGFQLDLYAPHEWTYMYAFLEQILHKLLFPLCQLADSSQPVQSPSPLEAPKITSAGWWK
ncbi:unnamed protein product [Protopolystoma xenopodis]|uniref:NAA35-like TPR repeats domain-containing protein n=1 Tax=Protopolystoma xenopodis TaxID=117903 RepID=A0A448WMS0_9PLAT|nr:unnamed protein product [Protopolystoma xenopodis]